MALLDDEIDLVGLEISLRLRVGHSLAFELEFLDADNGNVALDVSSSTITTKIYRMDDDVVVGTFSNDMSNAVNGFVQISIEDTSLLDYTETYKWSSWKIDGTVKTFLFEGPVSVEKTVVI